MKNSKRTQTLVLSRLKRNKLENYTRSWVIFFTPLSVILKTKEEKIHFFIVHSIRWERPILFFSCFQNKSVNLCGVCVLQFIRRNKQKNTERKGFHSRVVFIFIFANGRMSTTNTTQLNRWADGQVNRCLCLSAFRFSNWPRIYMFYRVFQNRLLSVGKVLEKQATSWYTTRWDRRKQLFVFFARDYNIAHKIYLEIFIDSSAVVYE